METPSPWTRAALCAGRTTLGASLFPLVSVMAYAVGHTYGAVMAVVLPGGIVFVVALLTTLVAMVAGRRSEGFGTLGLSLASLFAQGALLVVAALAWDSTRGSREWRPQPRRSAGTESPSRPRHFPKSP